MCKLNLRPETRHRFSPNLHHLHKNGVDLSINYIKNCEDLNRPVIKYVNMTLMLSEKCELIANGCTYISCFSVASVGRTFKLKKKIYLNFYFQYEILLIRDSITIQGSKAYICNEKYSSDLKKAILVALGLVDQCSVEKNTMNCFKNKTIAFVPKNIRRDLQTFASKQSSFMLTATFEHDTGKSCLEAKFAFKERE